MKKTGKRLVCLLAAALLFTAAFAASADSPSESPFATYTYTRSGDMVYSPALYELADTVQLRDSQGGALRFPTDFSVDNNGNLLVTDNGNNRVLCYDSDWNVLWELRELSLDGETYSLSGPYCTLQAADGCYYISDSGPADEGGNFLGDGRIYKLDSERRLIAVFRKPEVSQLADDGISYSYMPQRFVVDDAGRLYVIAQNVNEGFLQLDKNGEFQGFIGAPPVTYDAWQILLRRFSTKEQRKRMESYVPTEYSGIDLDEDGFLFAVTQTYDQENINTVISSQINRGALNNSVSSNEMIRKINASGADILRRRGAFSPIGDILIPNISVNGSPKLTSDVISNQETVLGSSKFVDIKALGSGMYAALDSNRSRVFLYDNDGNLLGAFGSAGERQSSFSNPVAIESHNSKLYVLNAQQATVTVCTPTAYGEQLLDACRAQYDTGTDLPVEEWEAILEQNSNCELAYDAIGKYYLDSDDAAKAMEYFKLSNNRYYYSEAFKLYRSDVAGRYFVWILLGIAAAVAALFGVKKLLAVLGRMPNRAGGVIAKSNYCFYSLIHPFDGFYCQKHERRGSVGLAVLQLVMLGVSSVLMQNASGFIFNYTDARYENILFTFLTVILPYLFFVLSNWCFNTLFDGKGTLGNILVFTGCATIPLTIANFLYFLFSFVLSADEAAILSIFTIVGAGWMVLLFVAATISVHDYTFAKAVVSLLCSILGIVILVFVLMFFYDIISKIVSFGEMLYYDLSIR